MKPPIYPPAEEQLVMDHLAFLGAAADVWMFVGVLGWFLGFFLALEGRYLSCRRSLDQFGWLAAATICALQAGRGIQGLLHFSLGPSISSALRLPLNVALAVCAAAVLVMAFRRVGASWRGRQPVLFGGVAILAADVGLAMVASNGWSPDGLIEARWPGLQALIGIGGQILLAWGTFGYLFHRIQRLRIAPSGARWRLLLEGAGLAAIIGATFVICHRMYHEALKGQHSHDLELARSAVLTLPVQQVMRLKGSPKDSETEAFLEVRGALTRFRHTNPAIEDIYLWIIRGDDFVTLADSPRREEDYMPPGLVFEKATPWDHKIYRSKEPWLYGPFRDNWGTFVCVNERIVIPGTDETFCWLGIDFETRHWLEGFADTRLLVMASAALLALMMLVMHHYRLRAREDLAVEREKQRIAERERIRVGRDLHDGLGQLLSAINIQSSILANSLVENEKAIAKSRELSGLAQRAVEFTRDLAHGLVPDALEEGDFRDTFEIFCRRTASTLNMDCTIALPAEDLPLRGETASVLIRVTQEAMNNAARHGGASRVDIRLTASRHRLHLRISDNGLGKAKRAWTKGIGTFIMRTRIEELGGDFRLNLKEGIGAILECSIPYPMEV